jgi:5-formyltetrahydrofolate cyclo-ligase
VTLLPPEIKARLRAGCLARRKAIAPAAAEAAAAAMLDRLEQLDQYLGARLLHTYVSSVDNEVDTLQLIRRRLAQGQGVAVPVVRPGTRILRHALIEDLGQLQPGRWGLLTPAADHAEWLEDLARIDLVVVPGLAFDRRGNRLGLGGGYYDRFLVRVKAPKAGLTYSQLLLEALPAETHDIPMDIVITEAAVYHCAEERGITPHEPLPL